LIPDDDSYYKTQFSKESLSSNSVLKTNYFFSNQMTHPNILISEKINEIIPDVNLELASTNNESEDKELD